MNSLEGTSQNRGYIPIASYCSWWNPFVCRKKSLNIPILLVSIPILRASKRDFPHDLARYDFNRETWKVTHPKMEHSTHVIRKWPWKETSSENFLDRMAVEYGSKVSSARASHVMFLADLREQKRGWSPSPIYEPCRSETHWHMVI